MILKGAIFDMDGTLMDSMHVWRDMGRQYLLSHGIPVPHNLDERLRGLRLEQAAALFHDELQVPWKPEEIVAQINASISRAYLYQLQLKPGAKDYLTSLHRQKTPICLLTATDKQLTIPALKRVGILDMFSRVLTCGELNMSKEYPEIYRKAASLMGFAPEEVAVFEDAPHAVQSARDAGCFVIAVRDDAFPGEVFPGACETIDHWPWRTQPFVAEMSCS